MRDRSTLRLVITRSVALRNTLINKGAERTRLIMDIHTGAQTKNEKRVWPLLAAAGMLHARWSGTLATTAAVRVLVESEVVVEVVVARVVSIGNATATTPLQRHRQTRQPSGAHPLEREQRCHRRRQSPRRRRGRCQDRRRQHGGQVEPARGVPPLARTTRAEQGRRRRRRTVTATATTASATCVRACEQLASLSVGRLERAGPAPVTASVSCDSWVSIAGVSAGAASATGDAGGGAAAVDEAAVDEAAGAPSPPPPPSGSLSKLRSSSKSSLPELHPSATRPRPPPPTPSPDAAAVRCAPAGAGAAPPPPPSESSSSSWSLSGSSPPARWAG